MVATGGHCPRVKAVCTTWQKKEPMDQGEDNLLARLIADVDRSFERLMLSYWHQLYTFVVRHAVRPQDAEDIVSEAFIRAYLALKSYPAERLRTLKLRSWLYKITYHEYCRYLERSTDPSLPLAHVDEAAILEVEDARTQPEPCFESAERRQELAELIAALPELYREAIRLYYFEEFNYQEIADLLEQPLGTVKSNVHRGLRLLRKALSRQSNEVY